MQGWPSSSCRWQPRQPGPAGSPTQGRYRHHTQTCAGSPDPDIPERALEPGRRWGRCSEELEEG